MTKHPESTADAVLDADVLRLLRATVLVTDRFGTIVDARGGAGRPLGYDREALVGHHGLEFIAPEDHQAMAEMYLGSGDLPVVAAPEPFPLKVVGPDGVVRVWDVVPGGFTQGSLDGWIVTMTCRQDQNASIDAMECFIEGGSPLEIAGVVARRYHSSSDDGWHKNAVVLYRPAAVSGPEPTPWEMLDCQAPTRPELLAAVAQCLHDGSAPWNVMAPDSVLSNPPLPAVLRDAAEAVGLGYTSALGIGIENEPRIVIMRFSNFAFDLQGNNKLADQAVASVLRRSLSVERSRELLDQALRSDPLTGVANRLRFDEVVAETPVADRHAVLFVDIDQFKAVNDEFGHTVGDETLREVAARIVAVCRPHDLVARIGGDEFAVILRDVTTAEAREIAERIRSTMLSYRPATAGPSAISVTVGVAGHRPDVSLSELVRQADHAMLADKLGNKRNKRKPTA